MTVGGQMVATVRGVGAGQQILRPFLVLFVQWWNIHKAALATGDRLCYYYVLPPSHLAITSYS